MISATASTIAVPLYRTAHSRTGDKGNCSNTSAIAWHPALWDVLVEQVTETAVARQFALRAPPGHAGLTAGFFEKPSSLTVWAQPSKPGHRLGAAFRQV